MNLMLLPNFEGLPNWFNRGKHIGVAYVFVDEKGDTECGGVLDQKYQTKEFFDKLVYELKTVLFESLED